MERRCQATIAVKGGHNRYSGTSVCSWASPLRAKKANILVILTMRREVSIIIAHYKQSISTANGITNAMIAVSEYAISTPEILVPVSQT